MIQRMILALLLLTIAATPSLLPGDEDFPRVNAVVRAVRKAGGAVVNISTERIEKQRVDPFYDFRRRFYQSPFEDFFDNRGTRTYTVTNLGSGVIIDRAGYIITNEHVIHGATKIMVSLPGDQTAYTGTLISAIPDKDLALIRIESERELTVIELGDSDSLMIGETAIALGNPFGLENTVTTGVVSAAKRSVYSEGNVVLEDLIQTDAAINPGNSGGALLDINGRLIGINTAIQQKAEGIGFAIPVNEAKRVLKDLLSLEKTRGLWFGATVEDGTDGTVKVAAVEVNSPAAKAGIVPGSVIERVNDQPIVNSFDMQKQLVAATAASATVNLTVNGAKVQVGLERYGENIIIYRCGLKGVTLTGWMARRLRISLVESGVLVTEVLKDTPAMAIGIEVGDVIVQLGSSRISKLEQLADALKDAPAGSKIKIFVARGNQLLTAEIVPN